MTTLESIHAKIAKLQAQAAAVAARNATVVLERIRGLMEKHGVTVADIEEHIGKGRGRKRRSNGAGTQAASAVKYRDPKWGATWTGHGRAPAWITNARDRSKFLVEALTAKSASETAKAGNYVRGKQPPKYRDPKSGATWSGRGRAPAWLAGAKDRKKFLIEGAAELATATKAKVDRSASAKKTTTKKSAVKSAAVKTVAVKTAAAPARNTSPRNGAAAKSPVAGKARVSKSAAKSAESVDAGVPEASNQVASTRAAA